MTMDQTMPCNIETGTSINIKRTDGRVHSAIVSGVNWEQRSVTVEWFEKGETKGKEVEMDAILALNPELTPKSMPPPPINNMMATRSRDSSGDEDEDPDDMDNMDDGLMGRYGSQTTRNGVTSATLSHSTKPSIPVKAGLNRQIPRGASRPTNIMPQGPVNGHSDQVSVTLTSRRELENIPPTPTASSTFSNSSQLNKQKQIPPPQQHVSQQQIQQQQQQVNIQNTQVENGRGRRSNVVKEVEKLKKNREERRQRQAELKEEKEALMNLDPGNPNWEFLAMIREYQNSIDFRPLRESDSVEDHQITVCVRKRPLNRKELTRKEVDVISVPSKDQMVVHEPKSKVDLTKYLENQLFRFDYAFDETCTNEIVYKYTAKPLVQTIFDGGMATCFAYGQTGSGKTHTMGGDFNGKTQDCKKGIYAMVAKDVFKYLKSQKYRSMNLIISASFFEIYSGKVFDLLADKEKLRVLEDGKQQVQIVGLTEKVVETCDEVLKLIQHGNSARTSGQTSANTNSSRSHAVFQIIARTSGTHKVHGKFSLIDLAGNERGADTSSANRQTRMEGAEINKSLLALKECIRALGRKGTHLPFRASKLTQVLRDSFIGENSKTCMIAMISPGLSSCEHSLNTLRYADRVKELAATDPTEMKISPTDDDRLFKIDESANDSVLSESDLAQLRSLNEGELSQDLYTFHEAVSALQMLEEEVLDSHKLVMDNTTKFLNDSHDVFSATHEVDYDQEDSQMTNQDYDLNGSWEDGCDDDDDEYVDTTLSNTSNITDTEDYKKLNNTKNFTFQNQRDHQQQRSPWKFEMMKSSSASSSQSSLSMIIKMTPRNNKKRRGVPNFSTKKFGNQGSKSGKKQATPRARWPTKSTKYSWTGKFNNRSKKNLIYKSYDNLDNSHKFEKKFSSITRTPSPDNNHFFYGNDPDIMTQVFRLSNLNEKNHQNINFNIKNTDKDLGQFDDDKKEERRYSLIENENDDDDDFVDNINFHDNNSVRNRFDKSQKFNWTLSNNNNNSWKDNVDFINNSNFFANSHNEEDTFLHLSKNNHSSFRNSYDITEEKTLYRKIKDFFITFFVNVAVFSILPIIYIAFFVYMHKDDE